MLWWQLEQSQLERLQLVELPLLQQHLELLRQLVVALPPPLPLLLLVA